MVCCHACRSTLGISRSSYSMPRCWPCWQHFRTEIFQPFQPCGGRAVRKFFHAYFVFSAVQYFRTGMKHFGQGLSERRHFRTPTSPVKSTSKNALRKMFRKATKRKSDLCRSNKKFATDNPRFRLPDSSGWHCNAEIFRSDMIFRDSGRSCHRLALLPSDPDGREERFFVSDHPSPLMTS